METERAGAREPGGWEAGRRLPGSGAGGAEPPAEAKKGRCGRSMVICTADGGMQPSRRPGAVDRCFYSGAVLQERNAQMY